MKLSKVFNAGTCAIMALALIGGSLGNALFPHVERGPWADAQLKELRLTGEKIVESHAKLNSYYKGKISREEFNKTFKEHEALMRSFIGQALTSTDMTPHDVRSVVKEVEAKVGKHYFRPGDYFGGGHYDLASGARYYRECTEFYQTGGLSRVPGETIAHWLSLMHLPNDVWKPGQKLTGDELIRPVASCAGAVKDRRIISTLFLTATMALPLSAGIGFGLSSAFEAAEDRARRRNIKPPVAVKKLKVEGNMPQPPATTVEISLAPEPSPVLPVQKEPVVAKVTLMRPLRLKTPADNNTKV